MSRRNVILLFLVTCVGLYLVYLRTEFTKQNNAYGSELIKKNTLEKEYYGLYLENKRYGEESRVVDVAKQLNMRKPQENERIEVH